VCRAFGWVGPDGVLDDMRVGAESQGVVILSQLIHGSLHEGGPVPGGKRSGCERVRRMLGIPRYSGHQFHGKTATLPRGGGAGFD